MKKAMYAALTVALVGLAACGGNRQQVAEVAEVVENAPAVHQIPVETGEVVKARMQGTDGITKRIYWVDAVFYPKEYRAVLTIGDKTYELEEYPTASGFGYRNAEVDLRGKGTEADLNFTNPDIRDLKLTEVKE